MAQFRNHFDALEATRPDQKFIPQELNLHFEHRFILDLCMHPRAIKAAQALLGPNVVLMSSAVITKYPTNIKKENYKGDFVGWHQDMKYWGLTNMKPNSRIKLASMWLAIDEANAENGAMQFISESHKIGFFEHVQSSTEGNVLNENQDMIIPEKWQEKIIQTELLPGECTFHDGMLIHGSKPTLGKRRMGIAVNYCQTSIRMDPMKYTKSIAFTEDFRQPVLVSGRDYYGTLRYVKTLEEMQDEARPKRVGKIQPKENSLGIVSRTYGNRVSRIHNSNNALQGKN